MKKEIKKPLPYNVKNTKTKTFAKRLLLGLFLFWTIGSIIAFSCLIWLCADKHKNDTSMITASADTPVTVAQMPAILYDLNGLSNAYFRDEDDYVYLIDSTIQVLIPSLGDRSVIIGNSRLDFTYQDSDTWQSASVTFFNAIDSTDYQAEYAYFDLSFCWVDKNNYLLDDTYRLHDVFYSVYAPDYNIISVAFRFQQNETDSFIHTTLHIRCNDEGIFSLYKSVIDDVSYDDAYVLELRSQILDLNYQISQLNNRITTLQISLEASEGLRESETALLNEEITTLRNASLNLQNIISQKNEEIEELEANIRDLTSGKNKIYQNGYDTGFADGATAGAADAYNQGYAAAVADGYGGGNFRSLIGALIDVPVNAITSLLDWNLLGINLKEFFFSILSVIVVVKIAMLFMR